jgi:hypothetical protein
MRLAEFRATLAECAPPKGGRALSALWWAAKGHWDRAHEIVQDDAGREAAWVHAYLHRVEGDLGNAAYWYRHARREVAVSQALDTEWDVIVTALLESQSAG